MKRAILFIFTILFATLIYSPGKVNAQDLFHKKYLTTGSHTVSPYSYSIMFSPWDSGYYSIASLYMPPDTGIVFTSYNKSGNIKNGKVYRITSPNVYHTAIKENCLADTTIELLIYNYGTSYSLKVDTAGNLIRALSYPFSTRIYDHYLFDDHMYSVGCIIQPYGKGLFMKHDSSGQAIWTMLYDMGPGSYLILNQVTSTQGGFLLAGFLQSPIQSLNNLVLIKTDSSGNIQWQKQYMCATHTMESCWLTKTNDNGFIVVVENGGSGPTQFIKVDSVGTVLWHFGFTGIIFHNVSEHSNTTFISTGITNSGEVVSMVIDSAGNFLQALQYTTGEIVLEIHSQYSQSRGLIAFSQLSGPLTYMLGNMFLKTDTSLVTACNTDTLSLTKYSYILTDSIAFATAVPYTITLLDATSMVTTSIPNLIETDYCSPTGIVQAADNTKFTVTTYPVPATDEVDFTFPGFRIGMNSIQIYDQTGRIVYAEQFFGNNFKLTRNNLSPGLYFYQLISQDNTATGKILFE